MASPVNNTPEMEYNIADILAELAESDAKATAQSQPESVSELAHTAQFANAPKSADTPETDSFSEPADVAESDDAPDSADAPAFVRQQPQAAMDTGDTRQVPKLPSRPVQPKAAPIEPESAPEAEPAHRGKKKKRSGLMVALRILVVVWVFEMLYFVVAVSDIPFIKKWRSIYIQTAMETMSHHWLADYFFPKTVVDPIRKGMSSVQNKQTGISSNMDDSNAPTTDTSNRTEQPEKLTDEESFYELFWEIDRVTMDDYIKKNADVLENGWNNIYINEAGLDDSGTSIYTKFGEQVLAIDAKNQILLIRVEGGGYRGVLAVAKDASQLSLCPSANIGYAGQYVGDIAANNNGILGMNGSGFIDPNGQGNGGEIAGYGMCDGVEYGTHYAWGYKRIELHENNKFYITDAQNATTEGTTDAVEFTPALIVDGTTLVDETDFWNGINPRACIGQSKDGEILMLVIEGRSVLNGIVGTGVVECARILALHNAEQAINLDGGSSAIMWFDGEYVNKCSNGYLAGRPLPNAWIYTERAS